MMKVWKGASMSHIEQAPKPGARGDAFLKNPKKYVDEARAKNRREVIAERRARRKIGIG